MLVQKRANPETNGNGASFCSFCRKPQDTVGKLISTPPDYPRAYICDECVRVCYAILEPEQDDAPGIWSLKEPHA